MDINTILNLVIGGVIGWLSQYLPFVKQLSTDKLKQTMINIISGVIGGGAGATAVGSLFANTMDTSVINIPNLIGAVAGSGVLSTISSIVLNKMKR